MRRLPRKGEPGWHEPRFDRLFKEIWWRYPASKDFEPCDCGVTLAVIPEKYVDPEIHFRIDDLDLRDDVLRTIAEKRLPYTAQPDGVLVICERA